jgi:Fic-DOC domain mobile mystery protein B
MRLAQEAEQNNIIRGQDWAFRRRKPDLLSEKFITGLHRHMLGDVWRWAGAFRRTERNLGFPHYEIPAALRHLLGDVEAWIELKSYPADEIAVRFHHRLVAIHPFDNGNGRHARLVADLLIMQLSAARFTWGRANLRDAGETRTRYITALRAADSHDFGSLVTFARS